MVREILKWVRIGGFSFAAVIVAGMVLGTLLLAAAAVFLGHPWLPLGAALTCVVAAILAGRLRDRKAPRR